MADDSNDLAAPDDDAGEDHMLIPVEVLAKRFKISVCNLGRDMRWL